MLRIFLTTLVLACCFAPSAFAKEALGRFGAWSTFRYTEKDQPVCYMIVHPPQAKTAPVKPVKDKKTKKARAAPLPREAYVTVTFRTSESLLPVFSYNAGAILKDNSESTLLMGKESFALFAAADAAWARTSSIDQAIVKTLRKSPALEARALTVKGGNLKDHFEIKGADAAYKKIAKACGVQ